MHKQADLRESLTEEYKKEVAAKFALTLEQLHSIVIEGMGKHWPTPKP